MSNKLFLVDAAQPSETLIQEATDWLEKGARSQLAVQVQSARTIWRLFKDLVEQREFPSELRPDHVREFGVEPDDDSVSISGIDALNPDFRQAIRPRAIEIARSWMTVEKATTEDDDFLRELGIAG